MCFAPLLPGVQEKKCVITNVSERRTHTKATAEMNTMSDHIDNKTLKEELEEELAQWQTKMDEAKVQLHLGAKDAQDKLQPHVDKLEQELEEAKQHWQQVEEASEKSLKDIEKGMRISITAMKK